MNLLFAVFLQLKDKNSIPRFNSIYFKLNYSTGPTGFAKVRCCGQVVWLLLQTNNFNQNANVGLVGASILM